MANSAWSDLQSDRYDDDNDYDNDDGYDDGDGDDAPTKYLYTVRK